MATSFWPYERVASAKVSDRSSNWSRRYILLLVPCSCGRFSRDFREFSQRRMMKSLLSTLHLESCKHRSSFELSLTD